MRLLLSVAFAAALLASQPTVWKAALFGGLMLDHLPLRLIPVPALQAWISRRTLPKWRGGQFRKWLKTRGKSHG